MKIFKKEQTKSTTEYKLFGFSIYKKLKLFSSKSYYIFNILYYQKFISLVRIEKYLFGIKISDKRINLTDRILPHAKGKDFIYFSIHSGEFYYTCAYIKQNFEKFKDTVIITNLPYIKMVFELFDFDQYWLNEHFILVPELWIWSYGVWAKANGEIISEAELSHHKGWIVNNKLQKDKNGYFPIKKVISNFLGVNDFQTPLLPDDIKRTKTVLLLPEGASTNSLKDDFVKNIVTELTKRNYKILINTKGNKYDYLLSDNVSKTFENYKDTYKIASECCAVIGVRNGLLDNLQSLAFHGVNFFIIFEKWYYYHYKFFKNLYGWLTTVYGFNKINNSNIFHEYYDTDKNIIESILKKLEDLNVYKNV